MIIGNETEGYDNPYFTTLTTGANTLLEVLNVENVSGLTGSLDLRALNSLRELYANGTNVTGVLFADGGKLEIAELPAITSLNMKNLIYLATLDISDFSKLKSLVVENCESVDLLTIFDNAENISEVRVTGVNWTLTDTSLLKKLYNMNGIGSDGYWTKQSVVTGYVSVPSIKQQELREYQDAWNELFIDVDPENVEPQYLVKFVNYDGTLLEEQYVDSNGYASDPTKREVDPLKPKRESSVSTDYEFVGWDIDLSSTRIGADRTVTAVYSESTRQYTIKYVVSIGNNTEVKQITTAPYGFNVLYAEYDEDLNFIKEREIPTYTAMENVGSTQFYLFSHWDQSGFVDGDKTITAVFDRCVYREGYFFEEEHNALSKLRPVEVYALTKLPAILSSQNNIMTIQDFIDIQEKDSYSFEMGYDVNYGDGDSVEYHSIVSDGIITLKDSPDFGKEAKFTGSNYFDTGLSLLSEDRDFVLAIDYEMPSSNSSGAVLAQCYYNTVGKGMRLSYGNGVNFSWGGNSSLTANPDNREMLVIRHLKGENKLTIYNSNLSNINIEVKDLNSDENYIINDTLVFGASKRLQNNFYTYDSNAIGNVYWCKLWYTDLGDEACMKLAGWTHEKINLEVCGFGKYYLSDSDNTCQFSLLASHLLERPRTIKSTDSNAGGWSNSPLNNFLNTRFYDAIPHQIKAIIKKTRVLSSAGQQSTNIVSDDCYVTIPSAVEVIDNSTYQGVPYKNEINGVQDGNKVIKYMAAERRRGYDGGNYANYWLRSPSHSDAKYFLNVTESGSVAVSYSTATSTAGVLILISL